jgi:hypothetical protein
MVSFIKWYKHKAGRSLEPINNLRMAQGDELCEEGRNVMLNWNPHKAPILGCLCSGRHLRRLVFLYTWGNSLLSLPTHYVICSDQMDSQQIYAN